jgi:hypothetical protein
MQVEEAKPKDLKSIEREEREDEVGWNAPLVKHVRNVSDSANT